MLTLQKISGTEQAGEHPHTKSRPPSLPSSRPRPRVARVGVGDALADARVRLPVDLAHARERLLVANVARRASTPELSRRWRAVRRWLQGCGMKDVLQTAGELCLQACYTRRGRRHTARPVSSHRFTSCNKEEWGYHRVERLANPYPFCVFSRAVVVDLSKILCVPPSQQCVFLCRGPPWCEFLAARPFSLVFSP